MFFVGCLEVNSTWLITSKLANQQARKVLFTCVVYTKKYYYYATMAAKLHNLVNLLFGTIAAELDNLVALIYRTMATRLNNS